MEYYFKYLLKRNLQEFVETLKRKEDRKKLQELGVGRNRRPATRAPGAGRRVASGSAFRAQRLSWKVRYRTILWFFSQMSKLYRARFRLYRRQILQVNIRWKALDEIYKIYMLFHRSAFKISAKFRQTFSRFHSFIFKMSLMFPKSWHLSCLKFTN